MSLTQFNIWFPAIVVALLIAAFWDCFRRRFWQFLDRFRPGILREVGLDSQSREEANEHHQETIDMLNKITRMVKLPVSLKLSNSGETTAFDIEAQTEINAHHAIPVIRMIEISAGEGNCAKGTIWGMDWEPVTIPVTSYFPNRTSKAVTRPAKRMYERHANGHTVKRMKSSIILQSSIVIDPWVLVEIVELAKHCIQKENNCIFQLGNWAILYYNAGEVQMHLLKEGDVPVNIEARWQDGKTGITMRGLHLTGSQVKVGTKRTSKILTSAGPATQGAGDLDEFHLPAREFDVPGEDSLIYASKVVVVDGVSLIVRSEASFILPPREKNALIEAIWTRWLRISNSAKKMVLSLLFGAEDFQPEHAANRPELEFDPEQLELSVEHWKGLSQIELLNTRKEVLLYLQGQRASGIMERVGPPSPHSDLIFVRDEHYLECWQEGLRVLNEVIHRNSNDSHSHTHVRVRGGIQFLLGDFESALQDYDLAHLSTGGHQSTVLLERALVKCMLGRYSEAMHDVVAVITLNPNVNDIHEIQACIQQILDQQRAFQIVTPSGSSCQRPLLPDQEKTVVKIPDLLTGDEWHSGEIGSLPPISDAGTAGGSASDPPSKRAKSVGVTRAADWSMTCIAEALKLQLKLTNRAQSLRMNPRYHVRRIRFIVNILEDECDPDDIVKPLRTEDQELLNWQAPTEDLQGDLEAGSDLMCLSGRLCPYKNISHTLYSNVTDDDSNVQRRGPHPLSCYRQVSFRSAMLTKHSAAEGDVQTLFLYDGTPEDRSCWRWRSHDYIKELVLPEARSTYRAFWLVQWDIVDTWHVVQGGPDRVFCSNPASIERQDDLRKFHSFNSPWIAEVAAAGTNSPTSYGNGLNRHRGSDARTNSRMSIPVNEKPQTSLQTQPLRASGVDSVFITISENSTSGGDSTVDYSSMNAYDWKSIYELVPSEEDRRLPELPLQSKHRIFLSHSGAQRNFVNQLCLDLEQQLHHTPFFDKRSDSLPKGEVFPQNIFHAAQQCELAIVVLSEEYFSQSKWPMLELSAVVQSSKRKVLPLFFGLSFKEFKDAERRERWFQTWEAWAQIDPRVSVKDWKLALHEVERRIGLEYVAAVGEVRFREEILATVSAARVVGGGEGEDEWKSVDNFHYHNGDEEAVSEVLRSSDTHRIAEKWNQKDEIQELKIENGLQVAVKRGSYHDMSRSIIEQESSVLAGITHPNLCNFIKTSRTGLPASELMKHDLCSIIDSRLKGLPEGSTPFTWPEAIDIMLQIGEAMAFMHGRSVAHRDLKCQNILCTPLHTPAESGSAFQPERYYLVKLADFGLARSQIQSSDGETLMAGSSRYKAPEMLVVREADVLQRKADVYSFGIVCCEILTGKLPFEEYRRPRLSLHARRSSDNLILQGVLEALKKLIHQCLGSNPAQRPTFDHIVMKLRECKVQAHEDLEDSAQVQVQACRPHCLSKSLSSVTLG